MSDRLAQRPVDFLEISVRTANALKGEHIYSIGDLVQRTEADLLQLQNIAKRHVLEIKRALTAQGLRLRAPTPPGE